MKLKIAPASNRDVGQKVVRIPRRKIKELGIRFGDFVEVIGKKSTYAIVWPAYPSDEDKDIIRMDGIMRHAIGAGIGDYVEIKPVELKELQKVTIAPTETRVRYNENAQEIFRSIMIDKPYKAGDIVQARGSDGSIITFVVTRTIPPEGGYVSENTEFILKESPEQAVSTGQIVTYDDIGGLKDAIEKIREMVELPITHPELFERLGIEPPKGVLLYGPPGTGKTLLAKAVANEANAHFIAINGPEIMSKYYGESEKRLREVFEEAEKNAPSIIFIDEIDALAPKRGEGSGEAENRIVAQLLTLMDGLKGRGKVIVIGATNRPDAIDPALRRPGRFDREIEVGVPDKQGRKEILQIHTRGMPIEPDFDYDDVISILRDLEKSPRHSVSAKAALERLEDTRNPDKIQEVLRSIDEELYQEVKYRLIDKMLDEIAEQTYGFVGADLAALAREAAMIVIRRLIREGKIDFEQTTIDKSVLDQIKVRKEDFYEAMKYVSPSAMREVLIDVPNVRWDDIGGLEDVKQKLKEMVEWPLKYPNVYKAAGITPPKGILLYGPPGTGKTLLAKAVANESNANFIAIKGPEILSKWVGESEKRIREIFAKARQVAPTIVFIDEIDSIAPRRGNESNNAIDRVVNQLLTEMDGIEDTNGVVVIGATNRPDMIDPALLRPGRFDRLIEVPLPDRKARVEIFRIHTRNMPLAEDVDIEELAELTDGFSGAEIAAVAREAGITAIKRAMRNGIDPTLSPAELKKYITVTRKDFIEAINNIKKNKNK